MKELTVVVNAVAALEESIRSSKNIGITLNEDARIKVHPWEGELYLWAINQGWVFGDPIKELV